MINWSHGTILATLLLLASVYSRLVCNPNTAIAPKTGIAKMSNASRKMKDGSPEKRAIEAELNLWQGCSNRMMEGDELSD